MTPFPAAMLSTTTIIAPTSNEAAPADAIVASKSLGTSTLLTKPKFNFSMPTVAVVGASGTGKSTAYRNMPWDKTLLIDCELKGLPFNPKSIQYYNECRTSIAVEQAIAKVKASPGAIKYVIIDSFYKYLEMTILECGVMYKGYDIYTNYVLKVRAFLREIRNYNLIFICICADELVSVNDEAGKATNKRRIATFGKALEDKLELDFLVVLYASVRPNVTTKAMDYQFLTNNDGIASAKSPMGMFDKLYIPNDLDIVVKALAKNLSN